MNNYQSLQNYLGIQNIDDTNYQNNLIEEGNPQAFKKFSNESSNIEDDSKLDDDSRRRNKRRSKNDNDGRSHKCQTCGKAYLSYPALYTHIKTKHDMQGAGSGKGRGRPKKDIGVSVNSMRLLYNPSTFDFFKHPERCGETLDIETPVKEIFYDIYFRIKNISEEHNKKILSYSDIMEHPLLYKIYEIFSCPKTPDENSKCDEIFAFYVFKISKHARPEFFKKILKFILLFRECLNILYEDRNKTKNNQNIPELQYSQIFNCEDAPDISNEFVTDYLKTETNLFEFNREEIIDLTQNFCQWLYDNNYTCSKLSLISSY